MGLLLAMGSKAQTREFGKAGNLSASAFYILLLENETDSVAHWITEHVKSFGYGVELVISEGDNPFKNLEVKVNDGINFGNIDPQKVFVIDLTDHARGSLLLLEQDNLPTSRTIVLSGFNSKLYHVLPGQVKFYPGSNIRNKQEAIATLDYFQYQRKWGIEVSGSISKSFRTQDSLITHSQKGLISFEYQTGMWFLLSNQENDRGRFNVANNGWNYQVNLGYGLSDRIVLRAGLGISLKLPNEDEQLAQLGTPEPGIRISNETRNQIVLMPSVGLKYYFKTGRFKYYGLLSYQHTSMELINFKVFTNSNGEIRDRRSTKSLGFNAIRYGLGIETNISPRFYFNFQIEGLKSEKFDEPVNEVSNFDNLSFSLGLGIKLGIPKNRKVP